MRSVVVAATLLAALVIGHLAARPPRIRNRRPRRPSAQRRRRSRRRERQPSPRAPCAERVACESRAIARPDARGAASDRASACSDNARPRTRRTRSRTPSGRPRRAPSRRRRGRRTPAPARTPRDNDVDDAAAARRRSASADGRAEADIGDPRDRAVPRSQAPPPPRIATVYRVLPLSATTVTTRAITTRGATASFGLGYFYYSPWAWSAVVRLLRMATVTGYGYYPRYGGYRYDVGSVKLKVQPRDAEVWVDGYLRRLVDDFDGVFQALSSTAAAYRIEIRKPVSRRCSFDVRVQPERTITFRGEMKAGHWLRDELHWGSHRRSSRVESSRSASALRAPCRSLPFDAVAPFASTTSRAASLQPQYTRNAGRMTSRAEAG